MRGAPAARSRAGPLDVRLEVVPATAPLVRVARFLAQACPNCGGIRHVPLMGTALPLELDGLTMTYTPRRLAAATTLIIAGLAGSIAPAAATGETPAPCDPAALSTAVDTASAQARAAQKAYTTHTRTSMKALVAQLKARETREARVAAAKAEAAEAQGRKAERDNAGSEAVRQARVEARAAAAKARVEAREAARVRRASKGQLLAIVKAERVRLKAAWTQAKSSLADARRAAAACESPAEAPGA